MRRRAWRRVVVHCVQLLSAVYKLCQVDAGGHGMNDRWCSVLDAGGPAVWSLLERVEDAKSYHKYGPGAPLARTVPCLLAEEVFRVGDAALSARRKPVAVYDGIGSSGLGATADVSDVHLRFAHAETISLLLAMLVRAVVCFCARIGKRSCRSGGFSMWWSRRHGC